MITRARGRTTVVSSIDVQDLDPSRLRSEGARDLRAMLWVLRGGAEVAAAAGCPVLGGHSIDDPEPKYGMAVTGVVDPARMLRNDAARAGLPLVLTKPLGIGVLATWHKRTGERSEGWSSRAG